ncbi:MAG: ribonuclease D [Mariprofundaceae bacterium]
MNPPSWTFADTNESVARAAAALAGAPVLCVDTEFHRENTYHPEFALLQIHGNGQCWIIDPLAGCDLAPIWRILLDPSSLKVFHAGRQDLEIILHEAGALPLPLFDTQIAAALLGFGLQVGFGNLVQRITKTALPKGESFTDWKARPLTRKQLEYAANDVVWLHPVWRFLDERLKARGRRSWLDEEQAALVDPASYEEAPEEAFWRVKGVNKLSGRRLAVLRELAAWRERRAQALNIPRRRVIGDEQMVELARRERLTIEALGKVRGLSAGAARRFGPEIVEAWRKGAETPEAQWPQRRAARSSTRGTEMRLELLDTLVRLKAEEADIAPSILAGKAELTELASWAGGKRRVEPDLPCLQGWRRQLVGEAALALLRGETCLHLNPKTGLPVIRPLASMSEEEWA